MSVMQFDPVGDRFRSLDRLTSQLMSGTCTPMGVWQAEDGYHVALDLPEAGPGSVKLSTERNMLTVGAERRAEYKQGPATRQLSPQRAVQERTREL